MFQKKEFFLLNLDQNSNLEYYLWHPLFAKLLSFLHTFIGSVVQSLIFINHFLNFTAVMLHPFVTYIYIYKYTVVQL